MTGPLPFIPSRAALQRSREAARQATALESTKAQLLRTWQQEEAKRVREGFSPREQPTEQQLATAASWTVGTREAKARQVTELIRYLAVPEFSGKGLAQVARGVLSPRAEEDLKAQRGTLLPNLAIGASPAFPVQAAKSVVASLMRGESPRALDLVALLPLIGAAGHTVESAAGQLSRETRTLYHYAPKALEMIDPVFAGTNPLIKDAERLREGGVPSAHFYTEAGKPEVGVGPVLHRAEVTGAWLNADAPPGPFANLKGSELEQAAKAAGYTGLESPSRGMVTSFYPVKPSAIGRPGGLTPGTVIRGKAGQSHADILPEDTPWHQLEDGFVTRDGSFVTREQAESIMEAWQHQKGLQVPGRIDSSFLYLVRGQKPPIAGPAFRVKVGTPAELPTFERRVSPTQRTAFDAMLKAHQESGGSMIDLHTGKPVTQGFAVSPYKEREGVLTASPTLNDLRVFADRNKDLLAKPGHTIGTRFDQAAGKHILDVVITEPTKARAIGIARKHDQRAIFDLNSFQEIPVASHAELADFARQFPYAGREGQTAAERNVVLDPRQVKSSKNTGMFDPNDPRFKYGIGLLAAGPGSDQEQQQPGSPFLPLAALGATAIPSGQKISGLVRRYRPLLQAGREGINFYPAVNPEMESIFGDRLRKFLGFLAATGQGSPWLNPSAESNVPSTIDPAIRRLAEEQGLQPMQAQAGVWRGYKGDYASFLPAGVRPEPGSLIPWLVGQAGGIEPWLLQTKESRNLFSALQGFRF